MTTKTAALELAPHGIRVNCICPGATKTPMIAASTLKSLAKQIPLRRVGEPEDVAEIAFFSGLPARGRLPAAYSWLTAASLPEDLGWLKMKRFRRPINDSMPVYDRHMIDVVIDRWDEFAKKLKNGKAPVFTIWFSER